MSAKDIERLMNTIRVRAPGATDALMQLELFTVMDEFFKGSNAWIEEIEFDALPGEVPGQIYYLSPSCNAVIDKLMWMYEKTADNRRGGVLLGTMAVPGEIQLRMQPNVKTTIRAAVALSVADPSDSKGYVLFPEWVLLKHRNTIVDGVLGKLLSQPSKPYTNTQMSVYHLRRFRSGVATARIEQQHNNVFRAQAWRFPSFAGGSQRGGSGWAPPQ